MGADAGDAVGRFAVMEDDAVLCAECVAEAARDLPQCAGSIVRAWIDASPGVCCGWCGAAAQLDQQEG